MNLTEVLNNIIEDDEPKNIWVAAGDGDLQRVQFLLENGHDVNAKDENGYTPIHAAVSYGRMEVLSLLLTAGADVNSQDSDGDSPLHVCEAVDVAQVLIQSGVQIAAKNHEGKTAADVAVEDENEELARFLKGITTG